MSVENEEQFPLEKKLGLLSKPLKTYSKRRSFICGLCKEVFSRWDNLEKHISAHAKVVPDVSSEGQKPFPVKNEPPEQPMNCSEEKMYTCNVCKKLFSASDDSGEHLSSHLCGTCKNMLNLDQSSQKKKLGQPVQCDLKAKCGILDQKPYKKKTTDQSSQKKKLSQPVQYDLKEKSGILAQKSYQKKTTSVSYTDPSPFSLYKEQLSEPLRTYSKKIPYVCGLCKETFSAKDHLEKHPCFHTTATPRVSDQGLKLPLLKKQSHEQSMDCLRERIYTCSECKSLFSAIDNSLDLVSPHLCDACKNRTSGKDHLEKHTCSQTTSMPNVSDQGQKLPLLKNELHEQSMDCSREMIYTCSECKSLFSAIDNSPDNNLVSPHLCNACKNTTKDHLEKHPCSQTIAIPNMSDQGKKLLPLKNQLPEQNMDCSRERTYICSECTNVFSVIDDAPDKHLLSVHLCDACKNMPSRKDQFTQQDVFQALEKLQAKKTKRYQTYVLKVYTCEKCHKEFSLHNVFKRHKCIHDEKKTFTCDICLMQFFSKSALGMHLRIHTGEKPYVCDVCQEAFHSPNLLKNHLLVHSRLHECKICRKTFSAKISLTLHLRTHSGKRFYFCDVCERSFSCESKLVEHEATHIEEILSDV